MSIANSTITNEFDLSSVRLILGVAAATPPSVWKSLQVLMPKAERSSGNNFSLFVQVAGYAMTEVPLITFSPTVRAGSVGVPMPGAIIKASLGFFDEKKRKATCR